MTTGNLYIVATPIGNLNDITLRALEVLKQVDLIAAEDTRHSRKLLDHYQINTRMVSLHEHNEEQRIGFVRCKLEAGENIALISDAGTPLISDPGYKLVQEIRQVGLSVLAVPGPCAAIAALSIAGLPTDQFLFAGFLPAKNQARYQILEKLTSQSATLVFYESPRRIVSCMKDLANLCNSDRAVAIAKELTKSYETVVAGTALEIVDWLEQDEQRCKGEFVVIVEGKTNRPTDINPDVARALRAAREYMPLKKACALIADLTGLSKNDLYSAALADDA